MRDNQKEVWMEVPFLFLGVRLSMKSENKKFGLRFRKEKLFTGTVNIQINLFGEHCVKAMPNPNIRIPSEKLFDNATDINTVPIICSIKKIQMFWFSNAFRCPGTLSSYPKLKTSVTIPQIKQPLM